MTSAVFDEAVLAQTARANTHKPHSRKVNMCMIGKYLALLPEEEQEGFKTVFSNPGIWNVTIVDMLGKRGVTLTEKTVRNHRSGTDCACFRDRSATS